MHTKKTLSPSIDFHVNILPDFARQNVNAASIPEESEHLKHCFDLPVTTALNERCTADQIITGMDEAAIGRSVVFSYQWNDPRRCLIANEATRRAVNAHPDRLLGLAVVQPKDPQSMIDLERSLLDPLMIGVKMKPRWGNFALSNLDVMGPICEMLIAKNKLLLTHVSQGFHSPTGDQLTDLFALLRAFPSLKVVGAHMAGFAGVYETYAPARKLLQNLFVDISLPANLAWLPHLMRIGDPSRYLYATDWPYVEHRTFHDLLVKAGVTDKEMELLYVSNPTALLQGLGVE